MTEHPSDATPQSDPAGAYSAPQTSAPTPPPAAPAGSAFPGAAARDAGWEKVGEQFEELARRIGEHAKEARDAAVDAARPAAPGAHATGAATPAGAGTGEPAEAGDEDTAMQRLSRAVDALAATAAGAAADPMIRRGAKGAAASFLDALGVSLERAADAVRRSVPEPRPITAGDAEPSAPATAETPGPAAPDVR